MKKQITRFLEYTFGIMGVCWGGCLILGRLGFTLAQQPWLYVPYLVGGWSPTIGSYLAMRTGEGGAGLGQWLKGVFSLRQSVGDYVLAALVAVGHILPLCLIGGYMPGAPLPAVVFMVPVMMFLGGLEETGWRGILQPELEKKLSFPVATLVTAVIWWLWHLPLFLIPGVSQYGNDFLVFGLNVLGLSYGLGALKKHTGSTWLCVLSHSLVNSLSGVYLLRDNLIASAVTALILVMCSVIVTRKKG